MRCSLMNAQKGGGLRVHRCECVPPACTMLVQPPHNGGEEGTCSWPPQPVRTPMFWKRAHEEGEHQPSPETRAPFSRRHGSSGSPGDVTAGPSPSIHSCVSERRRRHNIEFQHAGPPDLSPGDRSGLCAPDRTDDVAPGWLVSL